MLLHAHGAKTFSRSAAAPARRDPALRAGPLPERAQRAIWEGRTARRREAPSTGRGWASVSSSSPQRAAETCSGTPEVGTRPAPARRKRVPDLPRRAGSGYPTCPGTPEVGTRPAAGRRERSPGRRACSEAGPGSAKTKRKRTAILHQGAARAARAERTDGSMWTETESVAKAGLDGNGKRGEGRLGRKFERTGIMQSIGASGYEPIQNWTLVVHISLFALVGGFRSV
jgi:hypothetical protein